MNYLLVIPRLVDKIGDSYMFPLGIAYISAAMKAANLNVINLNLNHIQGSESGILKEYIKKYSINVVLTGGLTMEYTAIKRIMYATKKVDGNIITICGGGIITSSPQPAMAALEYVDFGIVGEGEYTVVDLCQNIEINGHPENIQGLIYRFKNSYKETGERKDIINLDEIPFPDYKGFVFDDFLEMKSNNSGIMMDHMGLLVASRSCPFNCTFCFHPSGKTYRQRSLDNIFEEIDLLVTKYKIKFLSLVDELFSYNIDRMRAFCIRIKPYGIKWTAQFRVSGVTEEMIQILKDANCVVISYGVESADNTVLKSMQKHISIKDIENALAITYNMGLSIQANFIFGDVNETKETYMKTLNWWKSHRQYNIALAMIRIFPGTGLYKHAIEKGIIKNEVQFIKDGCPTINVSKLSAEEYKALDRTLADLASSDNSPEAVHNIQLEGSRVKFEGRCTNCGSKNTWAVSDIFSAGDAIRCYECGQRHMIPVFTSLRDRILEQIEMYLRKHKKIAFWGMGRYFIWQLYNDELIFNNKNIYLIDIAESRQGLNNDGKIIYGPELLDTIDVDIIIVTVPRYFADIEEQIALRHSFKGNLINIDNILHGNSLVKNQFEFV